MFIDKLIDKIKQKNNPSVIGLDPRIEYVPSHIRERAYNDHGMSLAGACEAIITFNRRIIDAVHDIVPAVKLQLACYEMYGLEGMKAYAATAGYAREKDLLVIADGKRNDIGSTAEAYSSAYLGNIALEGKPFETGFGADALTVNPYLGFDGIKPFADNCEKHGKGIFVLVKTSNKSSGEFQDLKSQSGQSLYEIIAEHVEEWGTPLTGKYGYSSIGAVVGATYPEQAKALRKIMKKAYILVPGYGAQGGTADDAAHSFNSDGLGAIVNASRSIMCARQSVLWREQFDEYSFDAAARAEAIRMRDDLGSAVERYNSSI